MKEKLIKLWERKERFIEDYSVKEVRASFFHQAFGALEMVMAISDNWEEVSELIDLWDNEWRARLEEKVYGEMR